MAALAAATISSHLLIGTAHYLLAWTSYQASATVLYYAATAAVLAAYVAVIRELGTSPSRRAWQLAIVVPLLIQIGWLLPAPVLAMDAYSYLVDAAHAQAGLNPYEHAVRDAAGTEFGRQLVEYRWRPVHGVSPYGPVWMNIVSAVGPLTGNIALGLFALKFIAFAATALTAWLIFWTVSPPWRLRAFSVFWWNPAIIIEGAGEAHNDAVMVAAVVLSLWCLRRCAPVAAAGALTIAVFTKWIPVFFAPIYLVHVWRRGLLTPRAVLGGGALIAAITAVAYWPLWAGMATFAGIRNVGGPRFVASTTGALIRVLPDKALVAHVLRGCAALATVIAVLRAAWTSRSDHDVIRACATIAVVYMLLTSPLYWAWYIFLPVALLALADDIALVFLLTAGSRLVAPLNLIRLNGDLSWSAQVWLTTILALWLPLAYFAWRALRRPAVTYPIESAAA